MIDFGEACTAGYHTSTGIFNTEAFSTEYSTGCHITSMKLNGCEARVRPESTFGNRNRIPDFQILNPFILPELEI